MIARNFCFAFLMTLIAVSTSGAAPLLEVPVQLNARDLELMRLVSEYGSSPKSKPLASKLEKVVLTSDKSVLRTSSLNPQTGAAAVEIFEMPLSAREHATEYELQMPIPRLQSQNAQNPSVIAGQTKSLDVRVASDLENRSNPLLIEDRAVEIPGLGSYKVEQTHSMNLATRELQFVSSNVTRGSSSKSVSLEKNGNLKVHAQGPGKSLVYSFKPSEQKEISDFLRLNPAATLESSYVAAEDFSLILVYRSAQGQRFEFSYRLPTSQPTQGPAKYIYLVKQNSSPTSIAARPIEGRQPVSVPGKVKGLMTTEEFLSTRRAIGTP